MTTTKSLKKIAFMTTSQYNSVTKSDENLYMVEFDPAMHIFPNYGSYTTISINTTYTVATNPITATAGWFRIGFTSSSWHGQYPQLVIYINGQAFYASYGCAFSMFYLTSGNTFKWIDANGSTSSNVNARFFPVR